MEPFLRKKYGIDIFFLTAIGAVFQDSEVDYLTVLKDFIIQQKIKTIYIVMDTSCIFINGFIQSKERFGTKSDQTFEDLYIDYYFSHFEGKSLMDQKHNLASLNIEKQINEILNSAIIGPYISEFNISVRGIVSIKEKNELNEVKINNTIEKNI